MKKDDEEKGRAVDRDRKEVETRMQIESKQRNEKKNKEWTRRK